VGQRGEKPQKLVCGGKTVPLQHKMVGVHARNKVVGGGGGGGVLPGWGCWAGGGQEGGGGGVATERELGWLPCLEPCVRVVGVPGGGGWGGGVWGCGKWGIPFFTKPPLWGAGVWGFELVMAYLLPWHCPPFVWVWGVDGGGGVGKVVRGVWRGGLFERGCGGFGGLGGAEVKAPTPNLFLFWCLPSFGVLG